MDSEIDFGLKSFYLAKVYRSGKWGYVDPKDFRGYVSDKHMQAIEAGKDTPYCTSCGCSALYECVEGKYIYALTNYCPNCGAILNPKIIKFVKSLQEDCIK